MARQKRTEGELAIARALIDEFGIKSVDDAQGALKRVLGPAIEAMLKGELDAHLGYPSNDKHEKGTSNRRNGYAPKTVTTSYGEVAIDV